MPIMQVSQHQPVCLCLKGFQRDAVRGCRRADCAVDNDCAADKKCVRGRCENPCAVSGACGRNAECRVVAHEPRCVCPPGHYGNPRVTCIEDRDDCAGNPCGINAVCENRVSGHHCKCNPGCTGDATVRCECPRPDDGCKNHKCGEKARCRLNYLSQPVCYCPSDYPKGDPDVACQSDGEFLYILHCCSSAVS